MQSVEFLAIGSFRKFQIFFISQNPDFFSFRKIHFFSFHKIQIHRLATSFSDSENSPLECKLFLLSERLIICLPLFNIYNWFISQNPDFFSFRKIQFFFHFTKFRFTGLRPRFQIAKIVPWNARSFYYQNAPSHYMFTFV